MNWAEINTAPEGVTVMTKIDDDKGVRNESPLRRSGRLWYFADGSMYVYYTPTHWRHLSASERHRIEIQARAKADADLDHTLAGLKSSH